jgi:hypothetical protein
LQVVDKKALLLARPIEDDTNILSQALIQFEECLGLFEVWSYDGITASSVIVLQADIAHLDQATLIKSLFRKMQFEFDQKHTTSVVGDYFFLNFNFEIN